MHKRQHPDSRLRQERLRRGLTQERLGLALGGYTSHAVSRWEWGNRVPGTDARCGLERLFGLPWTELKAPADKD